MDRDILKQKQVHVLLIYPTRYLHYHTFQYGNHWFLPLHHSWECESIFPHILSGAPFIIKSKFYFAGVLSLWFFCIWHIPDHKIVFVYWIERNYTRNSLFLFLHSHQHIHEEGTNLKHHSNLTLAKQI